MDLKAPRGVRLGHDTVISIEAASHAAVDLFEGAEDSAIRELASEAHKNGLQFDGWPKFQRIPMVYGTEGLREARTAIGEKPDYWKLRAAVIAVPRADVGTGETES